MQTKGLYLNRVEAFDCVIMRCLNFHYYMTALSPNRTLGCYTTIYLSSVLSLLGYNVTHCTLKATKQLFKNKGSYHHNANERFGLKASL